MASMFAWKSRLRRKYGPCGMVLVSLAEVALVSPGGWEVEWLLPRTAY